MDIKKYIDFANSNPVCYLATIENDQPHVRAVLLMFANESGFYFETASPKAMSHQLHNNPKVEVCFYNNPTDLSDAKEMRIKGIIEFVKEETIIEEVYQKIKFLEGFAGQSLRPSLEVFKLGTGDAHFWTLQDILKEPEIEHTIFEY